MTQPLRLIAFYLPQFHIIPENNLWWGPGFTEWTNVVRNRPLFKGHYQPQLPADLGFYDLRLPEARQSQAELARDYGISGFCYYHYWFKGKRLLERPFNEVLNTGQPDFPFCLCWANENWTRTWDKNPNEILIQQDYSEEDDRQHIRWLSSAFKDRRYIRYANKPILLVYRASKLPDAKTTTAIWREEALKLGVGEIFLCRVESSFAERNDPAELGFDAAIEFQPDWTNLGRPLKRGAFWRIAAKVSTSIRAYQVNHIYNYSVIVKRMQDKSWPLYPWFPCVTPGWDNSSRRKNDAIVIRDSTPDLYRNWLEAVCRRQLRVTTDETLVFINGWNEWAEGNHLEPCERWGRSYLEATKQALRNVSR